MKSAKFLEHLLLQNNCGGCFSSRTTACKENCPQPQKLILTQTLTPTRGQISSRAIVWLLPTLKLTLTLTKTPTLTRGQFSSGRRGGGGATVRIPTASVGLFLSLKLLNQFSFVFIFLLR